MKFDFNDCKTILAWSQISSLITNCFKPFILANLRAKAMNPVLQISQSTKDNDSIDELWHKSRDNSSAPESQIGLCDSSNFRRVVFFRSPFSAMTLTSFPSKSLLQRLNDRSLGWVESNWASSQAWLDPTAQPSRRIDFSVWLDARLWNRAESADWSIPASRNSKLSSEHPSLARAWKNLVLLRSIWVSFNDCKVPNSIKVANTDAVLELILHFSIFRSWRWLAFTSRKEYDGDNPPSHSILHSSSFCKLETEVSICLNILSDFSERRVRFTDKLLALPCRRTASKKIRLAWSDNSSENLEPSNVTVSSQGHLSSRSKRHVFTNNSVDWFKKQDISNCMQAVTWGNFLWLMWLMWLMWEIAYEKNENIPLHSMMNPVILLSLSGDAKPVYVRIYCHDVARGRHFSDDGCDVKVAAFLVTHCCPIIEIVVYCTVQVTHCPGQESKPR